jgi:rubrerythrin
MEFRRCLICGELYLGTERPSRCPHCGSVAEYLVSAAAWVDENRTLGELSSVSSRNLERALQLEVDNDVFYGEAMEHADSVELEGVFKYLRKIEREHASVIRKILAGEFPAESAVRPRAVDDTMVNLTTARRLELEAIAFYSEAALEAVEQRVRRVFHALTEVETDHADQEAGFLAGRASAPAAE